VALGRPTGAAAPTARVVILRALGLGDLLAAVPALRGLARAFPAHERLLAAPATLAPLVALLDGAVERVVDVAELAPLPPDLHEADVAVNLHGRGPQSHRRLLAARPRRILWFAHPEVPQSADGPVWRADEHETVRWCRMLAGFGIHADPAELELRPPSPRLAPWAAGATIIHPGAASPSRRWPPERFAAVARLCADRGRVVITGSRAERPLARAVARAAGLPGECVHAGDTDLAELAAAVAAADRLICGDTGIAHLATAFATPSIRLFGPTPPAWWGPPAGDERHVVLWSGRRGDPHAGHADPGLLEIAVDDVAEALGRLADRRPQVRAAMPA